MIPCRACGGSPGAPRVGWRYDEECRACGAYGIDPGGPVADAPVPTPPAPRRPVAGWYERSGSLWLRVDDYLAQVDPGGRWTLWLVTPNPGVQWIARRSGIGVSAIVGAPITWSIEAAQLAAEDALRAVLVDAAAALGMRVVP